ncbi:MAG TPA: hybrid sensor histidine kinase/response regulator [Polyangiaceae bacterium]|jgi:signal transduction histidine kinase/DNA-binding response OmpR family regulator
MTDARTRILVVDDRREQLVTLKAMLGDVVDEIVCASSGRDALRVLLEPREFALMLLDIQMPGMDGFELAELVRQHRLHRHTPIIFVTASSEELHVQRCYALGAVDYILSPIVPNALRTKVAVLVDLHKKNEQVRRQAEVLRRRATQLHSLTNASIGIHAAASIPDSMQAAAVAARDILGAEWVVVRAAPAAGQAPPHTVVVAGAVAREGLPAGAHGVVSADAPVVRSLARLEAFVRDRGSAVRLSREELSRSLEWSTGLDGDAGGSASYVGAPLAFADGTPLGSLQVSGRTAGGDFDADDEAVVAQLAHATSVAIQNRVLGDAREANRLKDEFFTNLSHELRNPLNAVVGWMQLLRTMPADETTKTRALDALARNTSLLTRLVDDLLDVSRIAGHAMTIVTKPTRLEEVVRSTVDGLRATAEAKGVLLECHVEESPIEVLADAQRLEQVIWNLLSNALKFARRGGHVAARVGRHGSDARLTVQDDGEGISPEFLPYVFERFRQAKRTTTHGGGLGLGLSIVRAVVELHGGTVWAASEGIGQGATFTVRLPLRPSTAAGLDGYHLLLIEPDVKERQVLERGFAALGARVTAVADATEATSELRTVKPHVVVARAADLRQDTMRVLQGDAFAANGLPILALTEGDVGEPPGGTVHGNGARMHAPRSTPPVAMAQTIRSMVPAV